MPIKYRLINFISKPMSEWKLLPHVVFLSLRRSRVIVKNKDKNTNFCSTIGYEYWDDKFNYVSYDDDENFVPELPDWLKD